MNRTIQQKIVKAQNEIFDQLDNFRKAAVAAIGDEFIVVGTNNLDVIPQDGKPYFFVADKHTKKGEIYTVLKSKWEGSLL